MKRSQSSFSLDGACIDMNGAGCEGRRKITSFRSNIKFQSPFISDNQATQLETENNCFPLKYTDSFNNKKCQKAFSKTILLKSIYRIKKSPSHDNYSVFSS